YGHSYGVGVIVSTDNGISWTSSGFNTNYGGSGRVRALAIDPNSTLSNTIIYAATSQRLYKWQGNSDAAGSWTNIYQDSDWYSGPYHWGPVDLADVEVEANGTVWFCHLKGLYRIPAGSTTASLITNYTVPAVVSAPTSCGDPNPLKHIINIDINRQGHVVFAIKYVYFDANCNIDDLPYIYRTTNSGVTWQGGVNQMGINPSGAIRFAVSRDNSNVVYAEQSGWTRCVFKSTDFGVNFTEMNTEQNHVDVRFLYTFDGVPNDPNGNQDVIYAGNDGGITMTSDGWNWIDINGEGLACTNNYGVGITEANSDFIFTGAQDGSINFYNEGEWYETLPGGDNGDCLIDPVVNTRVYQQYQGALRRTMVTGNNTDWGTSITPPNAQWLYPILMNPNDPNEIFASTTSLQGSLDMGDNWTEISDPNLHPVKRIASLGMSANNDDIIYYAVSGYWWNSNTTPSASNSNYGGIFRADRSSGSWVVTDVTNNLNFKCIGGECGLGAPISDIAVDPSDEDKVWVTLGTFSNGNKVYHSTDGGANWINVSSCLPNIPFSSVVCQGGPNNQVYVGSDFGVFYKDDGMSDWAFYGNGGPRTLVADMEINRCGGKLVVATQGRGLWEVDLMDGSPVTLSSGTTNWTTPQFLTSDLIIPDDATLNITGTTVNIAKNVRIIVEEGAHLVVDNSTLTNACGDLWRGIEVWGDATQHQYTHGGGYHQGRLTVRNNSVIEYARNAVKVGKEGDWQMNHTGGIIWANNSTFRNNKRAVEFLRYQNFHPFIPTLNLNNRSYFRDCHFLTDEDLPANQNPNAFVTMWAVDYINFFSCDFENLNPNANTLAELGRGIYTEDASFNITGCTSVCPFDEPCCNPDKPIFRNLEYGVYAKVISSTRKFKVDAAYFENCRYGVSFEEVDYAQITRSDFVMGYTPDASQSFTLGIYNLYGTQYRIEENTFTLSPQAFTRTAGAIMFHTGEENNEIYKNTFDGMDYANLAIGSNGSLTANSDGSFDGLVYFCNEQVNSVDFDMNTFWGNGIRHYQGGLLASGNFLPAGNTFSHTGGNAESDVSNASTMNIIYIHDNVANEEPLFYTPIKVLPVNPTNIQSNTCPSRFGVVKKVEISRDLYYDAERELTLLYQQYDGKIDEGNTQSILDEIARAPVNDAGLKASLLGTSPFLSTTVVKEVVDQLAFTDQNLVDVLVANPDAMRQTDLMTEISENAILDAALLRQLEAGMSTVTQRGELEMSISYYKSEKERHANDIVHILMDKQEADQEVDDPQEILNWMQTMETLPSQYALVDQLFSQGQISHANSLLSMVPNDFALSQEQTLEYQDLLQVYSILTQLDQSGRNEYQLTEAEKITFETIAETGNGRAQAKARNLMSFFYGKDYPFELVIPDGTKGRSQSAVGQINPPAKPLDKVSLALLPNPASTELNIKYLSPSIYGNTGEILIVDQFGQELFQGTIDAQEKEFLLQVQDWSAGMYFCIYKPTATTQKVIPLVISR
ncbi:MAG: hypothetical protein AAFP19_07790, partial [Bacteroidota bacterium]